MQNLKISLCEEDCCKLVNLANEKKVYLEGNILKLLDDSVCEQWKGYLNEANEKWNEKQKKRLELTKEFQSQIKELKEKDDSHQVLLSELQVAHQEAENARKSALNDLDVLQKKKQTELTGKIVKSALYVIIGVGIVTTLMYILAIFTGEETQVIGSTWSNLTGILLTNAFSIVGTIMGVKHLSESNNEK